MAKQSNVSNTRRKQRVRTRIRKQASGRARLSVHRTSAHIYAQLIDDVTGNTLASASTLDPEIKAKVKNGGNKAAALEVGKLISERAKAAKVNQVVFDRGQFVYHGRVKELAEAARAGGLDF